MAKCAFCGNEISMFSGKCSCSQSQQSAKQDDLDRSAAEEAQRTLELEVYEREMAELTRSLAKIVLSTGTLHRPFEVLEIVFAMDSHEQGFLANMLERYVGIRRDVANPSKAFDKVKLQLRHQCRELGGDAVINCQFEHRVAAASTIPGLSAFSQTIPGIGGAKPRVEIFAYGTIVRFVA